MEVAAPAAVVVGVLGTQVVLVAAVEEEVQAGESCSSPHDGSSIQARLLPTAAMAATVLLDLPLIPGAVEVVVVVEGDLSASSMTP